MKSMQCGLFVVAVLLVGCGPPRSRDSGAEGGRTVIQNKGSDTLVNVAQNWAEAYSEVHPSIAVAVSGGGTGTGIAALINGTVDIANASRFMDKEELELAESRGRSPVATIVGYDAVAVFVHRNNPLDEISIPRLAEIYGDEGTVVEWRQLGVEVPGCRDQKIIVVSRQNNSGTYEYFRNAVLSPTCDFRLGTYDLHGSKDVVDLVEKTPCAIGYSGFAYGTENVKMLCLRPDGAAKCVVPSLRSAVDGSYVISRPLIMYTDAAPKGPVKDYVDWILSDEGQCIIAARGYATVRPIACVS